MASVLKVDRIQSDTGTVNVASKIEFPVGSAAAPSIFPTGDTNTGIFFPAADTIAFAEGGAEAMRIDSSGNIGIGTSSPGAKLDISTSLLVGTTITTGGNINVGNETSGIKKVTINSSDNAAQLDFRADSATRARIQVPDGTYDLVFGVETANDPTERARLTTAGRLDLAGPLGGAFIRSSGAPSVASGGTITLSSATAGGALIVVYNANNGEGGVFWANYSGTVTKLAGDGATTDSGSATINVYKSAGSHTTTFKNRSGSTYSFYIAIYGADFRT